MKVWAYIEMYSCQISILMNLKFVLNDRFNFISLQSHCDEKTENYHPNKMNNKERLFDKLWNNAKQKRISSHLFLNGQVIDSKQNVPLRLICIDCSSRIYVESITSKITGTRNTQFTKMFLCFKDYLKLAVSLQ